MYMGPTVILLIFSSGCSNFVYDINTVINMKVIVIQVCCLIVAPISYTTGREYRRE